MQKDLNSLNRVKNYVNKMTKYRYDEFKDTEPKNVGEFKIQKLLAKSDLGKVFLVKREKKAYAMKTIIKNQIKDQSLLKECLDEK